jgi:hypothetical protein
MSSDTPASRESQEALKPPETRSGSPDEPYPSGRLMLRDFDYVGVARDIIARANAQELELLSVAIRERKEELGIEEDLEPYEEDDPQARPTKGPVSGVLERRGHEDGELVLERRAYIRKDGSKKWRGPYWYFKYREGSKQKTIYLGKTDNPEATLAQKRL